MKIMKVFSILIMTSVLLTGCASSETPEQLLSTPDYNYKLKDLSFEISKWISKESGFSLALPRNSSEVASINKVDLDNDTKDEIVFFEQKQNTDMAETDYGFTILKQQKNEEYIRLDHNSDIAQNIEYANFYDLDNDGQKEIIICYKTEDGGIIKIYKVEDGKINEVSNLRTSDKFNLNSSTETRIKIGDLDGDNIADIIISTYDKKSKDLIVSLANFAHGKLKVLSSQKIPGVKNLNSSHLSIENIQKQKKGIVLDICMDNDMYSTFLLYKENGELKNVDNINKFVATTSYYIPAKDIDNDGIIDIPTLQSGYGFSSKTSRLVHYFHWNGKLGDNPLDFTKEVYYNYTYNFYFLMPTNLPAAVYVKEENKGENMYFEFEYDDRNDSKKIFTLAVIKKKAIDDSKNQTVVQVDKNTITLENTEEQSFVAIIHNEKLAKEYKLTPEVIKKCFKMIY